MIRMIIAKPVGKRKAQPPTPSPQPAPVASYRVSPAAPGDLFELLDWNLAAGRLVWEDITSA